MGARSREARAAWPSEVCTAAGRRNSCLHVSERGEGRCKGRALVLVVRLPPACRIGERRERCKGRARSVVRLPPACRIGRRGEGCKGRARSGSPPASEPDGAIWSFCTSYANGECH